MGTPFESVYDKFRDKITDYDLPKMTEQNRTTLMTNYLTSSCVAFKRWCIDLDLTRDSNAQTFSIDLNDEEIEILATGMAYYWINPKVMSSDNVKNSMSTRDWSSFSPAELLLRLTELKKQLYKDFKSAAVEYSFLS